ncbi:MAG TPA: glycosyl hydrolase family 18 protein, partial [Bacteroidota bacterium]|nr:glycosyl hydrolase family 18 protein [Bacteroidota bacterium]
KWFTTYYATWSMMPLNSANFALPPWEMDCTGLTHIVLFDNGNVTQTAPYWAYMFGPGNPRGARPSDTESDSVCVEFNGVANPGDGNFPHYMDSLLTISHRKGIKVVITIQAVNPTNLNYVTADSARTQLFVNTLVAWAERKGFDGVELDWEGWAAPLPAPAIINRFMRILYNRVHSMKTPSGAPGLIMVSAGSGQQALYDPSQDFMVDQFNLQLYDYAYAWYGKIGSNASWHISPLHKGTVDPTFEGMSYDTRGPLQWVAAGHDPKRIGLGVPTYGYILRNVDGLFQPMANPDYGSAHYQTIEALKSNGGVEEWDDVRKVRSIHGTAARTVGSVYYGSDGINAGQKFYAVGENPQSLQEKVNWMNQNNFGGIMTYDFVSDLDPSQSLASGKRNPLQRVVANALGSGGSTPNVVPMGTFSASAATLPSGGGTVTLSWTSSNAASASINQGVGTVAINGSTSVNVTATTTFTLTLTSSTGSTQQYSATVTVSSATVPPATGGTTKEIYNDAAMVSPWSLDGTYSTTFDLAATDNVYKGTSSIKFTAGGWAGVNFRNGTWNSISTIDPSQYDSLRIAIYGGTAGGAFAMWLMDVSGTGIGLPVKFSVAKNVWTVKSIPMSQFAVGTTPFAVIMLQLYQGTPMTFNVDDIALVGKAPVVVPPVVTPPSAPAFASPASSSVNNPVSLPLVWSKVTDATTYHLQLSTSSTFASTMVNDSTLTDSVRAVSGLSNNTVYYRRIRAKNSAGWGSFSVTSQFTTIAAVPSAPVASTPANNATGQPLTLSLTWAASSGATSYGVQLASDALFTTILANDTTCTSTSKSVVVSAYLTTYYWRVNAKNSSGTSAWSSVQSFTTAGYTKSAPYFTYTSGTGNNATVAIPASTSFTISGAGLVVGDEIGAFTPSGMCVGAVEWNNQNAALTVWGDNAQTTAVDGIRAGETIQYRVYRQSTNTVYPLLSATYQSGSGMYQSDLLLQLVSLSTTVTPVVTTTQSVSLTRGWNMIATTVKPDQAQIDALMQPLNPNMTIVKNGVGQIYWPSMSINTLGSWNYTQGYMIYMENAGTLSFSGPAIQPESTPIALQQGWNLAPYVRNGAMNAATATASLGSALTIIKNNAGQVYWPAYNINTIGSLVAGQSYQMFVSQASTLLYPANTLAKTADGVTASLAKTKTVHYPSLADASGDNYVLLIKTQGLSDGDEIAVKTVPANIIAGTGVVSNGEALVTVWSDDPYTQNTVEGALAGQSLALVRWSKIDNKERSLTISHVTDGLTGSDVNTGLTFAANGLAVIQTSIGTAEQTVTMKPTEYQLSQNYPNPFNPSTVIRYALPAEAHVTLAVYTMLGTRVASLVNEPQSAGLHEVSFNAAGYASGTYFYVLKAGAFQDMKKMILLK